jgi:hypothetical protein
LAPCGGRPRALGAACSYTNFSIGFEISARQGPVAGKYLFAVSPLRCDGAGDYHLRRRDGLLRRPRNGLVLAGRNQKCPENLVSQQHEGLRGLVPPALHRRQQPLPGNDRRRRRRRLCTTGNPLPARLPERTALAGGRPAAGHTAATHWPPNRRIFAAPRRSPKGHSVPSPIRSLPAWAASSRRKPTSLPLGSSPLDFVRYYDSKNPLPLPVRPAAATRQPLAPQSPGQPEPGGSEPSLVVMLRGDGRILYFRPKAGSASEWTGDADVVGRLSKTASGWTYQDADEALGNLRQCRQETNARTARRPIAELQLRRRRPPQRSQRPPRPRTTGSPTMLPVA